MAAAEIASMAATLEALQRAVITLQDELKSLRVENDQLKTSGSGGSTDKGPMKPLVEIDKKDVEKPAKFKGEPMQWRNWLLKLTAFLVRRDERCYCIMVSELKASPGTLKIMVWHALRSTPSYYILRHNNRGSLNRLFNNILYPEI